MSRFPFGWLRPLFQREPTVPASPPRVEVTPEASAVAKWWADRLRGVMERYENATVVVALDHAYMDYCTSRITAERIQTFQDVLEQYVSRWMAAADPEDLGTISVDYRPDATLRAAAAVAGIDLGMNLLPWKARTYFQHGKATMMMPEVGTLVLYPIDNN